MPTNPRLDELIGSQNVRLLDELVEFPRTGLQLGVGPYYDNLRGLVVTSASGLARGRAAMQRLGLMGVLPSSSSGGGWGSGGGGGWGDVLLQGAATVGGYFANKNANKQARRLLRLQVRAAQLGIGVAPRGQVGLGGAAPSGSLPAWPNQPGIPTFTQTAFGGDSMLDNGFDVTPAHGGGYTQAGLLGVAAPLAGVVMRTASRALPALAARLQGLFPALASGAAAALAGALLADGIGGDSAGPYANPKHNACTGILRGDVMAIRRVKRQGKRLQKVLRLAGVGRRSLPRGSARRGRKC